MLAPINQWNRLNYYDESGEYSLTHVAAAGTNEYFITPWVMPSTGKHGYRLTVKNGGKNTQHDVTRLGKEVPAELHPSFLFRTQGQAHRAAVRHDALFA